jgi:hypothetical protein
VFIRGFLNGRRERFFQKSFTFLKDFRFSPVKGQARTGPCDQQDAKGKVMNDKFDDLARNMAKSVTRRCALKKFAAGLAGITAASLGLANRVQAGNKRYHCNCKLGYPHGCYARYGFTDEGVACVLYCSFHCTTP